MELALENDDFRSRAVSPLRELGAYEALWDEQGATFKKIADKFRERPDALPSDFIAHELIRKYIQLALDIVDKANIKGLGLRVNGTIEYPGGLRDARHPIEVLYYQGWWDLVYSPSIAVVGTRNPTDEGIKRTRKLVRSLVDDNFTIVSGLARGIDTAAHTTAIERGGKTIAVLGTPLSITYPRENAELQERIRNDYLLISPVPFYRYSKQGPQYNKTFFPERNKVMSALTQATVIIEAGESSGTLVQARSALEQGRKLFVLDSCFNNKSISWPRKFEEKGAIRIKEYDDIRKHLVTTTNRD